MKIVFHEIQGNYGHLNRWELYLVIGEERVRLNPSLMKHEVEEIADKVRKGLKEASVTVKKLPRDKKA